MKLFLFKSLKQGISLLCYSYFLLVFLCCRINYAIKMSQQLKSFSALNCINCNNYRQSLQCSPFAAFCTAINDNLASSLSLSVVFFVCLLPLACCRWLELVHSIKFALYLHQVWRCVCIFHFRSLPQPVAPLIADTNCNCSPVYLLCIPCQRVYQFQHRRRHWRTQNVHIKSRGTSVVYPFGALYRNWWDTDKSLWNNRLKLKLQGY